ncbi:MAG: SMC-Scp complex subunit ScpB, partial [Chloroflexi bacterium]|nr:SMC-Scp complex subunit ScpB [Chloroflexota bacterium]
ALLFVSSEPVPVQQIAEALNFKVDAIERALIELRDGTEGVSRGLRLQRKGDKVQLTTHPECAPYIERFLGLDLTSRLSKPALETLSIIAYQQPVTRAQIEQVRGVNCDGVLANLLNKGLIEEVGRLETAGRPIQYGTTFAFLQHFGLRGLDDMPQLQPIEAAALEAMAARPDEPVVVADAQMAETKTADGGVKTAEKPAQPILETQLALVPDETSAPEEAAAADEAATADETAAAAEVADKAAEIEQSGGDEPPPVTDVNEAAESSSPPLEANEAAAANPIESAE